MGRGHRYKQPHPVLLLNLVSLDTREGRVLAALLEKDNGVVSGIIKKELTLEGINVKM